MKILVADPLHEAGIELLREAGEVKVATGLSREELLEKVKEIDALLVRSATKVTREVIENAPNLKVIGRAGVGVDNIDLPAATERGIVVVNAPEATSITVAEHTMGLILSLARRIPAANASLKAGKWEKKKFRGVELRGKILGVIGLGRIGMQVVQRAKAFEMKILAYDPYVSADAVKGVELVDLDELLGRSDFVTLHVPINDQTRGLIGREAIQKMKPGAYLINCARGGVVDEEALLEALRSGHLAGAGLDVFEKEPPEGNPLLQEETVFVTPHLGASTEEAQRYASTIACEEVLRVLQNEPARNVVNMPVLSPDVLEEVREYLPFLGLLGKFSAGLVKGGVQKVDVTYAGTLSECRDLTVLTNSVLCGLLSPILTGGINLFNAPLIAKNRGISVTEGRREDSHPYPNLIVLRIRSEEEERSLKGTLFGNGEGKIVEIDGYPVDLTPRGKGLLIWHEDRPKMIGKVALALGDGGVNIGTMQVGRREKGGVQLMVLTVDHEVPPEVVRKLQKIEGVKGIRCFAA
jgi:D-3-phosphoglycerate dehydrogenase